MLAATGEALRTATNQLAEIIDFSTEENGVVITEEAMKSDTGKELVTPDTDQAVSLLNNGDQFERKWWTELKPYLSKYEVVWRLHVFPLRSPGSILLRAGIDEDLEMFAMNHYTAFVNMARALEKIENKIDDLKFPEEIWSNLQRAIEVAMKKAVKKFSKVYLECIGKEANIDIQKLRKADEAVIDLCINNVIMKML